MATKDWSIELKGYYTPDHYKLMYVRPGIARVTLFFNEDLPNLNLYYPQPWGIYIEEFKGMRHVNRMDSRGDVTIGGRTIVRKFKTKSQALAFAKSYMRKH